MISTDTTSPSTNVIGNDVTVATCYYIRKLLAKHADELQSCVVAGAGMIADSTSDLNHVLESLYLEEPDISLAARELEVLAQLHQNFSNQNTSNRSVIRQLAEVERRIFWILGLSSTLSPRFQNQ
ncbi:hypothetical protein [Acaryochloris sp. IP29b_bin.137]|uniref:hypothetical protein n=1 Tax=Acaryochloris sp. IP29b_bin.137 TaxID=2969217 RepID=UPI00260C7012|nr:hypothetical protein [Acaryochloris sp. IP29b_bin.137]